jgi:3-ketosteroid 9alpha-monooxygenase subunit A
MPMPFGWYQVAYSHELAPTSAIPLHYFDTELVLFRTTDGDAAALDAWCPHMGAHLGYGVGGKCAKESSVRGDSIVCPFHGWAFNSEGQCTDIPYAKTLPPKVAAGESVIRAWPVRELNQAIFIWYHPRQEPPAWEPEPVAEAVHDNDEWCEAHIQLWEIDNHMQEVAENAVDTAHFQFVHGTNTIPEPELMVFDQHRRRSRLCSKMATPRGEVNGIIDSESIGPGQAVVRFSGICDTVLMANLTPIDREHTKAFYAFLQKDTNGRQPVAGVGTALVRDICRQMDEDSIIWRRKKYMEKPMLCDGDGPIARLRRWYSQFYTQGQTRPATLTETETPSES